MTAPADQRRLPLGADPRFAYTLHLDTGEIVSTANPAIASMGVIVAEEISTSTLHGIFEKVGYTCTFDRDGDLLVESTTAFTNVLVDPDHQHLRFVSGFSLNEFADEDLKLSIANRLNDEFVLVRFYIADPTTLLADYTIPYDGGLSALRIVELFDRFAEIVIAAFAGTEDLRLIAELESE